MEEIHDGVTDETLRGMIRRLSIYDLLLFFVVVPLLMVFVYFLPTPFKQSYFILFSNSTNPYSLFLSNYTHSAPLHIVSNLTVYFTVMFLLFNIETDKKIFRVMMALIFVLLPWLLSWYTISLLKNLPPSQGVSGLVAALDGYLAFSAYRYIKRNFRITMSPSFPSFVFSVNMLIAIEGLTGLSTITFVLIVLSIVTAVLSLPSMIATGKALMSRMRLIRTLHISKRRRELIFNYRFFVWFVTTVLVFSVFLAIPKNPVEGTTLTNSVAHYIGYVFGLFVPLISEIVWQTSKFILNWKRYR